MTHLQQTTFENIVTKGEIAQNEQFLLLSHSVQLCSVTIPTTKEIFHIFLVDIFKVVCCIFAVCGKGLKGLNMDLFAILVHESLYRGYHKTLSRMTWMKLKIKANFMNHQCCFSKFHSCCNFL